jgi:hypothetical protein
MFLCGPKRQFKNMFDKKRKGVTIVYLSTLFLSIVICFIKFNKDAKLGVLGESILYSTALFAMCVPIKNRFQLCNSNDDDLSFSRPLFP